MRQISKQGGNWVLRYFVRYSFCLVAILGATGSALARDNPPVLNQTYCACTCFFKDSGNPGPTKRVPVPNNDPNQCASWEKKACHMGKIVGYLGACEAEVARPAVPGGITGPPVAPLVKPPATR